MRILLEKTYYLDDPNPLELEYNFKKLFTAQKTIELDFIPQRTTEIILKGKNHTEILYVDDVSLEFEDRSLRLLNSILTSAKITSDRYIKSNIKSHAKENEKKGWKIIWEDKK